MKNWKRFIVPGLGGVLLGAAAIAAGRRLRGPQLEFVTIPEKVDTFEIVTAGAEPTRFRCRKTPFKVWALLGGTSPPDLASAQNRIYHVESQKSRMDAQPEAFYATLHGVDLEGRRSRVGNLAIGGLVEFRECRVGGAVNGVETGRRIRSEGVIKQIDSSEQTLSPAIRRE